MFIKRSLREVMSMNRDMYKGDELIFVYQVVNCNVWKDKQPMC